MIHFAGHVLPARAVRHVKLDRWDGRRWRTEPDRRAPLAPLLVAACVAAALLALNAGGHPALVVLLLAASALTVIRVAAQSAPARQYRVVVHVQFLGELAVTTSDPATARELLRELRRELS